MKKIMMLSVICLSIFACKKDNSIINKKKNITLDSIFVKNNGKGIITKTIFYPSYKLDSFNLRAIYENDYLKDSSYISKNGYIKGLRHYFVNDTLKNVYEYLVIDNKNYINQFWAIKNNLDTLNNYGNYYRLRTFDTIALDKSFQVELMLTKSYKNKLDKVFFLYPKKGFSKLNNDFSNIKEIEMDTIYSLYDDSIKGNEYYDTFWSKRSVTFRMGINDSLSNVIRGVLVERKDSSYYDNKGVKYEYLDRFLYVNKSL